MAEENNLEEGEEVKPEVNKPEANQEVNKESKSQGISRSESVLDISPANLTPGMQQYQDVKRAHPDCLVMLRMGDFYEMFYEDAIAASRELEITLTARGQGEKRAPLAGVPYHALEPYLSKLVKKGYKIAIVEQLEDPKKAKGLVKRGVVRIVTPGMVIESSMLDEKENNYLLAISAFGEKFALACCDLSTGEFSTYTIEGIPSLLSEISRLNPSECLLPESLQVNHDLIGKIKSHGPFLNTLEDYYFRVEKAQETLLSHFQLPSLHPFGLEHRPMNISVSGALLKYLTDTQKNSLTHIKKISWRNTRQSMVLDANTMRNLELTENISDGSRRGTLLSVLDKTVTAMGSRLLKKWLREPLLEKEPIERRLEAIGELNKQVIAREEIISLLEKVQDVERLISRVNYGNASPRDLLSLRNSLRHIPLIKEKVDLILKGNRSGNRPGESRGGLLKEISTVEKMDETADLIQGAVREDAPITIREGGLIKPGYHPELDCLHDIRRNSRHYLRELEEKEKQRTGINTLKLGYTKVFGYFIEVTRKNLHLVPGHYIRKQTTANSERYITEELKTEEEKILGAQEKIEEMEYSLFRELLGQVAGRTAQIQDAAGKLAVLDVLCSLAKVAMENNYCRPELVGEKVIQLKNSRHPVLEKMQERFIPNDISLSPQEMIILTGPNMSGKSSLMRQVALTVLLSQIGSFVPADKAVLGIVDRVFTRAGARDDLSSGQSTFMVEMCETAAILNQATENSLIILDEIGRGTSTFDGVSLAWSVAEHIGNRLRAKTLFSTHYHVMNKLAEKFDRIRNYNLMVRDVQGGIVFLYKLVEGGTDQSYGIHVAKLAGLPPEVVERAREIQQILEKDDEMVRKVKARKLQEQMSLEKF